MRATALLLIALSLACAPVMPVMYESRRASGHSDQYQFGEARLVGGENLFDVLRRTRPTLLRIREIGFPLSNDASEMIGVYVDGHFAGGLDALRSIPADYVLSVKRLRGIDATNRYASRHREGILDVRLLRR